MMAVAGDPLSLADEGYLLSEKESAYWDSSPLPEDRHPALAQPLDFFDILPIFGNQGVLAEQRRLYDRINLKRPRVRVLNHHGGRVHGGGVEVGGVPVPDPGDLPEPPDLPEAPGVCEEWRDYPQRGCHVPEHIYEDESRRVFPQAGIPVNSPEEAHRLEGRAATIASSYVESICWLPGTSFSSFGRINRPNDVRSACLPRVGGTGTLIGVDIIITAAHVVDGFYGRALERWLALDENAGKGSHDFLKSGVLLSTLWVEEEEFGLLSVPRVAVFGAFYAPGGGWLPIEACHPVWVIEQILAFRLDENYDYAVLRVAPRGVNTGLPQAIGRPGILPGDLFGRAPLRGWTTSKNETIYSIGHPGAVRARLHVGQVNCTRADCEASFLGGISGPCIEADEEEWLPILLGAAFGISVGLVFGPLIWIWQAPAAVGYFSVLIAAGAGALTGGVVGGLLGYSVGAALDSYFGDPHTCLVARGLNFIGGNSGSSWLDGDGAVRGITKSSALPWADDARDWLEEVPQPLRPTFDESYGVATRFEQILAREPSLWPLAAQCGGSAQNTWPVYCAAQGSRQMVFYRDASSSHLLALRRRAGSHWTHADETRLHQMQAERPDVNGRLVTWTDPSNWTSTAATYLAYVNVAGTLSMYRTEGDNRWANVGRQPAAQGFRLQSSSVMTGWFNRGYSYVACGAADDDDLLTIISYDHHPGRIGSRQIQLPGRAVKIQGFASSGQSHLLILMEDGRLFHLHGEAVADFREDWDRADVRARISLAGGNLDGRRISIMAAVAAPPPPFLGTGFAQAYLGVVTEDGQAGLAALTRKGGHPAWMGVHRNHGWVGLRPNAEADGSVFVSLMGPPLHHPGGAPSHSVSFAFMARRFDGGEESALRVLHERGLSFVIPAPGFIVRRIGGTFGLGGCALVSDSGGASPTANVQGAVSLLVDLRHNGPATADPDPPYMDQPLSGRTGLPIGWEADSNGRSLPRTRPRRG